jgi:hypothetical protein
MTARITLGLRLIWGDLWQLMMQCENEETQQLGHLLFEALGRGGVQYSHIQA